MRNPDWIITNPPFRLAERFALKALSLANTGVALLVRTVFIESVGRHDEVDGERLPVDLAQARDLGIDVAAENIDRDGIAELEPQALGELGVK